MRSLAAETLYLFWLGAGMGQGCIHLPRGRCPGQELTLVLIPKTKASLPMQTQIQTWGARHLCLYAGQEAAPLPTLSPGLKGSSGAEGLRSAASALYDTNNSPGQ